MQNQSWFVKAVVWSMVFLMSVGFLALIITPFMSGGSLLGNDSGRGATEELLEEARADVKRDDCTKDEEITGKRLERCRESLTQMASAYRTLATTPEDPNVPPEEQELPRDYQRNLDRAEDAYKAAYELDTTHAESAERYAAFLRDQGDAAGSLKIWTALVKADPKNEDYLLNQAAAHEQAGNVDLAISTYRTFLKRFPDSGRVDGIREQIKTLQEQKQQQAEGGGAPGGIDLSALEG